MSVSRRCYTRFQSVSGPPESISGKGGGLWGSRDIGDLSLVFAQWQQIFFGGPWVEGVWTIDGPVLVGMVCGMHGSHSKYISDEVFFGAVSVDPL